jgi:hypothetical protein
VDLGSNCIMEKYDNHENYCRKLGHYVQFKYCRTVADRLPCSMIQDCWFEIIPVQEYLQRNFSEEELTKIFNPPKNKVSSLIDMIEKAKNI